MCSNQLHQQNDSHNWTKLIPSVFRIARCSGRVEGGLRWDMRHSKKKKKGSAALLWGFKRKFKKKKMVWLHFVSDKGKLHCLWQTKQPAFINSNRGIRDLVQLWFVEKSFESEKSYIMFGNDAWHLYCLCYWNRSMAIGDVILLLILMHHEIAVK